MKSLYFISKNFLLYKKGNEYTNYAITLRQNDGIEVLVAYNIFYQCLVCRTQNISTLDQDSLNRLTSRIVKSIYKYRNNCHEDLRNLIEKYNMIRTLYCIGLETQIYMKINI
jgi:hypothetical protein